MRKSEHAGKTKSIHNIGGLLKVVVNIFFAGAFVILLIVTVSKSFYGVIFYDSLDCNCILIRDFFFYVSYLHKKNTQARSRVTGQILITRL